MGRKIYVGNLPYSVTEESLTAKFAECGQVESTHLITDRDTGRSKGFAFIEMATESEARVAVEKHNGVELDGQRRSGKRSKGVPRRTPRP